LSILLRAIYRLEVNGLDNLAKAGPNPIIALDHVSWLDAALILAVLPNEPIFAIDRAMARRWQVKPFLKRTPAILLDPSKPLGVRALVNAVKAGHPLVVFLEGRLAGAGLIKAYDSAGLIADKSGAMVVPVRLDGPEASIFSRFSRQQARRRWFPKFTLTILEPVRLTLDDALAGILATSAPFAMSSPARNR
ncbi:MAG: 1-acyl-sn-glycerol-3-phosphate acyltransferase, partial [Methylocystis sp.]|nr:1-acyl-sn-glycerol-3-phosphate acyltransferase [Methylocystis sp.]